MTRKDYVRLAQAFKNRYPQPAYESAEFKKGFEYAMNGVVHTLASDNPKFDRDHFLAVVRGEKSLTSKPVKRGGSWRSLSAAKNAVRKTDKKSESKPFVDFSVRNEGSIFLLTPFTPEAKQWATDHLPADAQTFGYAIVVEHRYIQDIVRGIQADGLTVE